MKHFRSREHYFFFVYFCLLCNLKSAWKDAKKYFLERSKKQWTHFFPNYKTRVGSYFLFHRVYCTRYPTKVTNLETPEMLESIPLKVSESGDYCEWHFDLDTATNEFKRLLITYGFADTKSFLKEQRDDDHKIIHGEGYSFYFWFKPEVVEFYKSQDEAKASKDQNQENLEAKDDRSEQVDEEAESSDFRTREETYELVETFRDSVYGVMEQDVYKPAPIEPVSDGFMFKISEFKDSIDIDFELLNQHYLDHCDALYESLFDIIEKTFEFEIVEKEILKVVDLVEDGKKYCASNMYFRVNNEGKTVRLMNGDIKKMKKIQFAKPLNNDAKKFDKDLDFTTFPIKNLKVYFEKTQRVDKFGAPLKEASENVHQYYTMNFHMFFLNYYGPNQKLEEKMVAKVVDDMETVYCLNFQCEPDLDTQTQLNFTFRNEKVNPEHYMIINYFKPSFLFEHMIQNAEDAEEIAEEDEEGEKLMHHEEERKLVGRSSLVFL